MKKWIKIIGIVIGVFLLIVLGSLTYISTMLPNVGPAPEMEVEITQERVDRGKYLANHVMLCMDCHAVRDFGLFAGPPVPGSLGAGGEHFDENMGFPGVFISPNITPFGIGDWTDGELFRLITTGVTKDNEAIFPVMPYTSYGKLDAEDIKSVIAYLRTLESEETDHPDSKVDFPLNFIINTMPQAADLKPMPDPSDQIAYGKYLTIAGACADCHTKAEGGKVVGEYMAGGFEFLFPDGRKNYSSNLTPHQNGLGTWSEEQFVRRFKMYADSSYVAQTVAANEFQTIMPWEMYAGMKEEDLKAIFAYLQTLEPVDNAVVSFKLPEELY